MENLEELYIAKLNADKKMNIFFKYFSFPKNPLFIFATPAILSEAELLTNSWIPSILAIYIMWEYVIINSMKYEIAEKCVLDEIVLEAAFKDEEQVADWKLNCPGMPIDYVTEEERDGFMLDHVLDYKFDYKHMSFTEKIKEHHEGLMFVSMLYVMIYMVLKYLPKTF